MKLPMSSGYDQSSYEKPDPGKYLGRLVRLAFVGKQPSRNFEPTTNVLVGWQLFREVGVKDPKTRKTTIEILPSVDSEDRPHVIYQTYTASLGKKANLRKVAEAHLRREIGDDDTETKSWLGLAAQLDLTASDDTDSNGNPKYVNVTGVSSINPETQDVPEADPSLLEHWDDADIAAGVPVPSWANFWVGRSLDLNNLAKPREKRQTTASNGGSDPQFRRPAASENDPREELEGRF